METIEARDLLEGRPETNVPFGGVGDFSTGTGREQGSVALESSTRTKSVCVSMPPWR